MAKRTLQELIHDLSERQRLGEARPVVLLGSGASRQAGVGTMDALYRFLKVAGFDEFVAYIEPQTENERFRLLTEFLQTQDPHEVTPGYRALAALCEKKYFDFVLTTNFDPLLDDALATAGLRRRDYLLLINGVLRADRLQRLLSLPSPRVKVVKLHGDLFHRFMAWTPAEMEGYLDDIEAALKQSLGSCDFLVVGNSLRDERVRRLVLQGGGAIWFLSPSDAPAEIADRKELRAVTGPEFAFEEAFTALANGLSVAFDERPPRFLVRGALAAEHAATTDDLIAATVGLASVPDGVPQMTGFILAAPRVIVTDGFVGNTGRFDRQQITVVASTGRRFTTRQRHLIATHPFGPWVLEAPEQLEVRGLRLDPAPLNPNEAVRIAVAAGPANVPRAGAGATGNGVGLSSGHVGTGKRVRLDINPIGSVGDLVHIHAAVKPGASGGPVVDADLAVRGFVVAGSTDPDRPDSYLYPAEQWHAQLEAGPARRKAKQRTKTAAGSKKRR